MLTQENLFSLVAWLAFSITLGSLFLAFRAPLERAIDKAWSHALRWVGQVRDQYFIDTPAERILWGILVMAIVAGLVAGLIGGVLDGLVVTLVAGCLPMAVVRTMAHQRLNAIREQIETALTLMASRWRTSSDVGRSFEAIVEHLEPPLAQEAELVVRELRVGTPIDEVLESLERRVPIRPVKLMCVGIRQALPLGGNVAEVLEQIGDAVRESNRLEMFVDSKTTEGRTQAFVMGAMPFGAAYGLYKLDREIIDPLLQTSTGNLILVGALLFDLMGLLLILKITDIEV